MLSNVGILQDTAACLPRLPTPRTPPPPRPCPRPQVVPVEGAIESLHSAGQYVVLAVSELGALPGGVTGSLVVLDFAGGAGFGCSTEPAREQVRGRARGGGAGGSGRQQQQGQRAKQQQPQRQREPSGKAGKRKRPQEGEQQKAERGGRGARRSRKPAPTADEEAGPSRKRGRR